MARYVLEAEGIRKSFGGVAALKGVNFRLEHGKVHALMGENGAGKSTLMKLLLGFFPPDEGVIKVDGRPVQLRCTADALRCGVAMIAQELHPVHHMSVADNIFLGREPLTRTGLLDYARMHREAATLLEQVGVALRPQQSMHHLSVAQWQMVEIARAVGQESKVLIMDEPTSALGDREIHRLFAVIRNLNSQGVSIVYISHKLDEIYAICEDVTVLRDGLLIGHDKLANVSQQELVAMMVGQSVEQLFPRVEAVKGDVLLQVEHLTREDEFSDVSFSLRRGEILGITGLVGAGRTELVETLFGMRRADSGRVLLKGKELNRATPQKAIERGMVMVPEDRRLHGLVLRLAIRDNIILSALQKCRRFFWLDRRLERKACSKMVAMLQVKTKDVDLGVSTLSGGNQQKVVVAKALFCEPELIILDEPTRGIDVKTKSEIHALMSQLTGQGKAVLMVSSEIPEVLGMSDRVLVMSRGRIVRELDHGEVGHGEVLEVAMQE